MHLSKNRNMVSSQKKKIRKFALKQAKLFLLWVIQKYGPIHGYGIIQLLKDDNLPIDRASRIYPILNNLLKEKLISQKKTRKGMRITKLYTITKKGIQAIKNESSKTPPILRAFVKEVFL